MLGLIQQSIKKEELSYETLSDENDTKFRSIDYRDIRLKVELSYDTLSDEYDTKFWSIDYRDVR